MQKVFSGADYSAPGILIRLSKVCFLKALFYAFFKPPRMIQSPPPRLNRPKM